jgi:HSP20 family protein
VFSRQLILGDNLDTEHITASYNTGVLTLLIPVAEQAKPRKIAITRARPHRLRRTRCGDRARLRHRGRARGTRRSPSLRR